LYIAKVCCAARKHHAFPALPDGDFPASPWAASKGRALCSNGAVATSQRGAGGAEANTLQFKALCFAGFSNGRLTLQILNKIVMFFLLLLPPSPPSLNVLPQED